MISPPFLPVPPYGGYGGTERVIYELAQGLSKRRHTIYLFAPSGSKIDERNVNLILFKDKERERLNDYTLRDTDSIKKSILEKYHMFVSKEIDEIISDIDLANLHTDQPEIIDLMIRHKIPVAITCHFTLDKDRQKRYGQACMFIAQSMAHKKDFKYTQAHAILQGIRTGDIPFSPQLLSEYDGKLTLEPLKILREEGKDYAFILSRIDKRKGQHSAIRIAKRAKVPLVISGAPYLDHKGAYKISFEYYNQRVKPYIDNKNVFHIENTNEQEKYELMRFAKAMIFPTGFEDRTWKEPFGRVVAESLASGTPVVTYKYGGGVAEQIVHGKHGFFFSGINEAVKQLADIGRISRYDCRNHAHAALSCDRFVRDTEEFFETIVKKTG
jgi:glycosyltransferase involved in cell wall biosynthesis